MIRVLIVEDDFRVAEINRKMTERVPEFIVVGSVGTGAGAIQFVMEKPVDLILLDVFLPDMAGIEVLKEIRKRELPIDFILVTAAHDSKTIQEALRYGIFDYLIKPMEMERYQQALKKYRDQRITFQKEDELDQREVDSVRSSGSVPTMSSLPKGISAPTLEKVREAALSFNPIPFTLEQMAASLSLSKITAHRYLEFLYRTGVLGKDYQYHKVGRPTALYFPKERPGNL
ncbi:MAG: response regulator [Spirochaetes bacterium]|nr:response regulator [Spirochaetota bacterium]